MSKQRRTYTAEFKIEALRLWETSGTSAAQIERDLGIGQGCLRDWKCRREAHGSNAFPGHGRVAPEQERLLRLKREMEIVRQERDILDQGSSHLLAAKRVRFQFIEDMREEYSVILLCKTLGVSPSGYYAWRSRSRPRETAPES